MLRQYISVLFMLLFLVATACRTKELAEVKPEKLQKKKEKELVQCLDSLSTLRPSTLYSKIKCKFSDTTQSLSFKTTLRIVRDSAVYPLITYANIPVASALIRPDSVIISNKREKCFIKRDLSFIKESFGVDFDYKNIEELFYGLPIGFDTTQKYFQINDPFNYIISSAKKREIRRENRDNRERNNDRNSDRPRLINRRDNDENNVIIQYFLQPDLKGIKRIFIDSPDDTTTITIDYLSRDSVTNYLIPNEVFVDIVTPRNHIVLEMDYDKTEVNVPQEIYFIIPEEYGECTSEK